MKRQRYTHSTRYSFQIRNRPSIRIRFLRSLKYIEYLLGFFLWYLCCLMQLLLVYTLFVSGVVIKLWLAFTSHRTSTIDTEVLGLLGIFLAAIVGADYLILKDKELLIMPHAFFHLYSTCQYIEPERLGQFRLPQMLLRHPEIFDYGFVNGKFTIIVGKGRPPSNATDDEPQNIVESFLVSSQAATQNQPTSTQRTPPAETQTHLLQKIAEEIQVEIVPISKSLAIAEQPPSAGTVLPGETHIVDERQENKHDICHLILSVGKDVSLFIEGEQIIEGKQTKKRVEVPLNITQKAVIVYLALHNGVWIKHTKLIKDVYGECIDSTKNLFNKHIERIRENIKKVADNHFNLEVQLDPFERKKGENKGDSRWRTSPSCQIPNIAYLLKWRHLIQRNESVTREEWQRAARQLMKSYSGPLSERVTDEKTYIGGYFVQYLKEVSFSSWIIPFFKEYRKQYIYVLEHIAGWECKVKEKREGYNGLEKAAELYKECAYAASSAFVDPKLGEEALRKCIEMYVNCNKEEEAEHVCNVYAARIRNVQMEWEPEKATAEMIKEYGFMID